jgi:hypothetical protein
MKRTVIYPGLGPSFEVIAYIQRFDIEYEHVLQGVSREHEKFMW